MCCLRPSGASDRPPSLWTALSTLSTSLPFFDTPAGPEGLGVQLTHLTPKEHKPGNGRWGQGRKQSEACAGVEPVAVPDVDILFIMGFLTLILL